MRELPQKYAVHIFLFTTISLGGSQSASAFSFNFEDFGSPAASLIETNYYATFTEDVLRLNPDEGSRFGSAFFRNALELDANTFFSSHFQFRIHGERAGTTEGGDGLVFIIHNDPRGINAIGRDGSGLGYGLDGAFGENPISNSIGIAFDTYPYQLSNESGIELLQNGSTGAPLLASTQPFNFASGNPLNAWIDYDGTTDLLEVYLSQDPNKPTLPLLSYTLAIDSIVGSQAFFGFSAATGARFNIHDIESWTLSYNQAPLNPVPEPATTLLATSLALGSGGFFKRKLGKKRTSA